MTSTTEMRKALTILKNALFENSGNDKSGGRTVENLTRICKKLGIYGLREKEIQLRAEEMCNPTRFEKEDEEQKEFDDWVKEQEDNGNDECLFTEVVKKKMIKIKIVNKIIDNVPTEDVVEKKKKKTKRKTETVRGELTTPKDSKLQVHSNGIVEEEKNYYQIDIYKFYKKGLDGEEGLFNEMKENYNRLSDRAEELFIQYNNTIDKEKKEMIFENYEDYNKSSKKLLENILINFPYYFT